MGFSVTLPNGITDDGLACYFRVLELEGTRAESRAEPVVGWSGPLG